ncbi:MAG: hypothetical protein PHR56_07220 [Dehalococcoidales bacterium]|nr:hypothetical protein [Dehalococcoidales bacterium]
MDEVTNLAAVVKTTLETAKQIQHEVHAFELPPPEGATAPSEMVFPFTIIKNTRKYIERIGHQINGTYGSGCYDACSVMLRRLIETLIIECFESFGIQDKIKNPNGDYMFLSDLISKMLSESKWVLGRSTKKALPKLKDIGDLSAHSRRYLAQRDDIDRLIPDIRAVVQELIILANLQHTK